MTVDPSRHLGVFKPAAFAARNYRIDVIGVGSSGSRVALELGDLGVENIHLHDFDRVEEINIGNQAYYQGSSDEFPSDQDIGLPKVDALARRIKKKCGTVVNIHHDRVDGSQPLGDVVFLLTDTMSSRKEIWEKGLKFKLKTRLLIETRMGIDHGRIYALNPNLLNHVREWEVSASYTDEEVVEVSACGARTSVGATAGILAGLAVWQMIRWFAVEQGENDLLDNEIIFGLRSMNVITRQF